MPSKKSCSTRSAAASSSGIDGASSRGSPPAPPPAAAVAARRACARRRRCGGAHALRGLLLLLLLGAAAAELACRQRAPSAAGGAAVAAARRAGAAALQAAPHAACIAAVTWHERWLAGERRRAKQQLVRGGRELAGRTVMAIDRMCAEAWHILCGVVEAVSGAPAPLGRADQVPCKANARQMRPQRVASAPVAASHAFPIDQQLRESSPQRAAEPASAARSPCTRPAAPSSLRLTLQSLSVFQSLVRSAPTAPAAWRGSPSGVRRRCAAHCTRLPAAVGLLQDVVHRLNSTRSSGALQRY